MHFMNLSFKLLAFCGALLCITPLWAEMVYNRGNFGEPETLDPHKSSTVYEAFIQRDLFEGLVTEAADGTLIPGAATAWERSSDGLIYTFKIRPEAKWSNGDAVTAEDFVYSMRRLLDPTTAAKYASILYPIKNAEAVNSGELPLAALAVKARDEMTLEITLKAPTPYFLQQLVHHTAYPVHRATVEEHGQAWTRPGNLVGNGAYTLEEWVPQARITLRKDPTYHDADEVAVDVVNYLPIEDLSTALKMFRAGELDTNYDVPVAQIDWMRANIPDQFRVAPYLGLYYYPINVTKPPFDDVRVRRAIAMAIDREIITDKITKAGEIAAYSLVPPGTSNYQPAYADFKSWDKSKRMAEAKRLLADAGYGPDNPLTFTLSYNTSENHKKVAIAVAAMLKPLGVQVELFNTELKVHYNNLQEGDFEVGRAGWIADYDDAQNFLFLLESNNPELNYANYDNEDFDRLMASAAITIDLDERARLMQQAEAIALADMPYIPLFYYVSKNLVKPYVTGFENNVRDVHPTQFIRLEK